MFKKKDLIEDAQYLHVESNNIYQIIFLVESRHPDNKNIDPNYEGGDNVKWYDAVCYRSVANNKRYVRSIDSFLVSFKPYK